MSAQHPSLAQFPTIPNSSSSYGSSPGAENVYEACSNVLQNPCVKVLQKLLHLFNDAKNAPAI